MQITQFTKYVITKIYNIHTLFKIFLNLVLNFFYSMSSDVFNFLQVCELIFCTIEHLKTIRELH